MPSCGRYPVTSTSRPFRVTEWNRSAMTSMNVSAPARAVKCTVVVDRNVRSDGLPPPSVRSSATS